MLRAHRLRRALTALCLLVVTVELTGCSTISKHMLDQEYYLVEPSIATIQQSKTDPCSGQPASPEFRKRFESVSDQNVVLFSDCVKKMLRRRMNLARIARLTSASFAVLTAAAAAALGATAAAPLTAITALAATSAVIPEFSRIFGADERARAYEEGVALIEGAEGRYLVARAEPKSEKSEGPKPGTIPPDLLTTDGARFYVEVVASIKLVEQLLVAQLPKIEDIERAQGKVGHIGDIQVEPASVTLTSVGDKASVLVKGGVVTYAVSSAPGLVEIDNPDAVRDGARLVTLKRKAAGDEEVTVTLANAGGKTATVMVKGSRPFKLLSAGGKSSEILNPGMVLSFTGEGGTPEYTVGDITSIPAGPALGISPKQGEKLKPSLTVTVPAHADAKEKYSKNGTTKYTVNVKDATGRSSSAVIVVEPEL